MSVGNNAEAYNPSGLIRGVLATDPEVRSVDLIGSRATGTPTVLSDWDYRVTTANPEAVAERLPDMMAQLRPLAQLWDPLAHAPVYMIILDGAVKVDLFPDPAGRACESREQSAGSRRLHDVDAHFWDWNLWLGSKRLRGQDDLVSAEVEKMWHHLLQPLGASTPPQTQPEAIGVYLRLRSRREQETGDAIPPELGLAVLARLRAAGVAGPAPT